MTRRGASPVRFFEKNRSMKLSTPLFPWIEVLRHMFRPLLDRQDEGLVKVFLPLIAAVGVTWVVAVPVHELLHAAGCALFGGTVYELTIQPIYGGGILEGIFPFVRAGGEYAGQLTEFDTHGSDVCYFATDYLPFVLTIFLGLPMLVLARRKRNTALYGIGFVHTVLPVISIPGDFYEMGSIVVTRLLGFSPESPESAVLRGDDFFVVLSRVQGDTNSAGIADNPLIVVLALAIGCVFCTMTVGFSLFLARALRDRKPLEK